MVIWDYNLKGYTHANHLTSVWQAGVGLCDVDHNEIFPCSPTPVLPTPPSPALDKQNWCFTYSSKTVLCNVLNIKEILNNFTTIFCAEIPCTYIFISCTFIILLYLSISANGFQSSLRRLCSSFYCTFCWITSTVATNTLLTCTGRYSQLLQLLQTKPVIAQDVTLTWPKYIHKDKPTSRSSLTSL